MFLSLKNLTHLYLSRNSLSVIIKPNVNGTLPQFVWLGLVSCNLNEFPKFLRYQKRLELLELSYNPIGGKVPEWFWNTSTQTLEYVDLQNSFFTGNLPPILPFVNMRFFLVNENSFTGPVPIPPHSTSVYQAKNNSFSGNIPTLFCNLESMSEIPQMRAIDLSANKLQGKLPRSLVNCTMLQYLNLEYNKLDDVFPHWLGTLPELKVLLLGSNHFRGEIKKPEEENSCFPQLQIIVLSYNNFRGLLPSRYFQCWKAMQENTTAKKVGYSNASTHTDAGTFLNYFQFSIKIKGVNRQYIVINEELSIIDLSRNNFIGEIPETIGSLKGLRSLDLSSNNLGGHVPSSLKNLKKLESLDLSSNRFSGNIPQQLTGLTFLQYFNVSYNRLDGPIPQAGQLGTFARTSYEGNSGLCGIQLKNKCEAPEPQPSSFEDAQEESSSLYNFGWKVVAIGYGCGFIIGLLIGKVVVVRRQRWFAMIFRVRIFK